MGSGGFRRLERHLNGAVLDVGVDEFEAERGRRTGHRRPAFDAVPRMAPIDSASLLI